MSGRRRGARRAALVALATSGALAIGSAAAPAAWTPGTELDLTTNDRRVATVVDADGNTTAVWESGVLRSAGSWQLWSSTRPAGGAWSTPAQVASGTGADQLLAELAVDSAGAVTAVWAQGAESNGQALSATIETAVKTAGGAWGTPATIGATADVRWIDLVSDAAGNTTAVWQGGDASGLFIRAARQPSGSAWQPQEQLTTPRATVFEADVATRAGDVAVVWAESSPFGYVHGVHRPAGGSWSAPTRLSNDWGKDVSAAIDGAGDVIAVWAGWDSGVERIGSARLPSGGSWTAASWIGDGRDPAIAANGAGDVAVSWTEEDWSGPIPPTFNLQLKLRPSGGPWPATELLAAGAWYSGERRQIAYDDRGAVTVLAGHEARHRAPSGTWDSLTDLTSHPSVPGISLTPGPALGPRLSANAAGDLVAAFQTDTGGFDPGIALVGGDVLGPRLGSVTVPGTGTVGVSVGMSVSPSDVWSTVASTRWAFGDGNTATGAATSHTYASAGAYTVTVTSTDTLGQTTTERRPIVVS